MISTFRLVAADAGCGKTTLIADFLSDNSRPSVWYQLDHTDADPIVFYIFVQGIANNYPGFGEALFPYLAEANEDILRFPERTADLLINEILRSVEQPFILVLDDYHHLGSDTIVHKIVDRVLQYASEYLHLIITTRDLPPLAIMRRRTQSAALVITREDLLFTDEEVRELFRTTLNVELKDNEIAEYRSRTHGWITALQLVRQVAEKEIAGDGSETSLDLTEILQQSEKDIFDYFAEEVFSRETEETRDLLLHVSLLESMPLQHLQHAFSRQTMCGYSARTCSEKHFSYRSGRGRSTEEYRFHPLFRGFLQRRLRSEIGQAGVATERGRIAEAFLDNRQWELALPFLLDAGNFERAAEVIATRGKRLDRRRCHHFTRPFRRKGPGRISGTFSKLAASRCRNSPAAGRNGKIDAAAASRRSAVSGKRGLRGRSRGAAFARQPGAAKSQNPRGPRITRKGRAADRKTRKRISNA